MTKCLECGQEVAEQDLVCSHCGASLVPSEVTASGTVHELPFDLHAPGEDEMGAENKADHAEKESLPEPEMPQLLRDAGARDTGEAHRPVPVAEAPTEESIAVRHEEIAPPPVDAPEGEKIITNGFDESQAAEPEPLPLSPNATAHVSS